jgi:phospholipase/lecithinase/hemolysin
LVFDLPDLGKIPVNVIDPVLSARASALSALHNSILYAALARLQTQYPKLHLIPVTLAPLFDDLQSRHAMEAFPPLIAKFSPDPLAAACLFINPVLCNDLPEILFIAPPPGSIFWDIVHPTTEAHQFLGKYMFDQLVKEYD